MTVDDLLPADAINAALTEGWALLTASDRATLVLDWASANVSEVSPAITLDGLTRAIDAAGVAAEPADCLSIVNLLSAYFGERA